MHRKPALSEKLASRAIAPRHCGHLLALQGRGGDAAYAALQAARAVLVDQLVGR
jgi:hypothetical protein